ncbi:VanW family protein [Yaniella flava]|uniref:VanW family protein n=1 Tax=Yaniella flava TaxID=287930 RepID=A0ABN2UVU7_9MICC
MADEHDPNLDASQHDDEDTVEQSTRDTEAPEEATPDELDAETRMLQQIAALREGDQPVANADQEQPGEDATDTAATPSAEDETEKTKMFTPIAASGAAASAGSGAGDGRDDEVKGPRKKRRWPWIVLVVIVLLGAGYVATAFATEDSLPASLTVEGVDVSGLSLEEAAPVLEEELGARASRELTVTAADVEAAIVPADSGYAYDVDATLDDLTDLTFDPVEIWGRLFGEAHVSAVTSVDESAAQEAVAGLSEQLTFDPTEGSVTYEGDTLEYAEPIDGFTVDAEQLSQQLNDTWLSEETEIEAPGDAEDPAVSGEQWEQFVAATAQPLIDDTYTVTADDTSTELAPAQLGAAAEVTVAEGEEGDSPVLSLDGEALTDSLAENNAEFESTNQDATVELTGAPGSGQPEVVPGSSGSGVDGEQVVDEILADLNAEETTRAITVDLHEVEPDVTTEEAEAWDVNHAVAEYATPYPASDGPRTANLEVGVSRINGTVVMPGEEFNLNSLLAPVTEANGYHSSGVVESGVATNAVGGGLSQIATMSYNAGFLGGMEIVEHKPHSRWFERYPQGRESTYWEGQVNVRWKNDTDAPVIVEMWLAGSQVHTRLWGSDYYDVSTTTSDPYNYTQAPTIHNTDDECTPETGGRQGFTVDVHRSKTPPEGSAIQESWSWAYSGWPTVICD